MLLLAFAQVSNVCLARSKNKDQKKLSRKERRELKRQERAAKNKSNDEDISEKAQTWVKDTWTKVKNSLFGSEESVNSKWKKTHSHHKKSGKKQRRAKQAEHQINKHHATSTQLLQSIDELNDATEKKHIQKYHRQSRKGKKEAESGREDLEYALKQVAEEADRIQKMNDENLSKIKECRAILIDYQNEVQTSLRNQEKEERKKQKQAKREERNMDEQEDSSYQRYRS